MAPVTIYTTPFCGFWSAAKALLNKKGISFTEIDVAGNAERHREMLDRANGRRTVPQIFIGSTHVGGFDDLRALEQAGRLDPLLVG